jgi:hypothetical protein
MPTIWHDLMQGIYVDPTLASVIGVADLGNPPSFRRPDGIQERSVCVLSALKNDIADCPARSKETFLASPARRYDRSVPAEAGGMPDPKARTTVVPEGQATVIPGVPLPVEEGVVKMQVVPLFQTVISGTQVISETLPNLNIGSGDPMSLPVPRYCAVTSAADQQSGAVTQLFIVAPNSPLYRVPMMEGLPDAEAYTIAAQRWAASAGIAIAPAYSCTPELLAQVHQQQPQPGNGDPGSTGNQPGNEHIETTYTIASPHPEQVITQTLPIIGTALFSPDNIDYYKITIQGPAFRNNEETTLGNTHTAPIRNGVLETLGAPSLPPGRYILRLILVQKDGNFSHPFQVPIVIAPPGGFPPGP